MMNPLPKFNFPIKLMSHKSKRFCTRDIRERVLSETIKTLERLLEQKSPLIEKIKEPSVLLKTLHELDDLVEMEATKEAIAHHVKLLLVRPLGEVPKGPSDDFLHTVISGPPGVGKSTLAKILARIWSALGLLQKPKPQETKSPPDIRDVIIGFQAERLGVLEKDHKVLRDKLSRLGGANNMGKQTLQTVRQRALYLRYHPESGKPSSKKHGREYETQWNSTFYEMGQLEHKMNEVSALCQGGEPGLSGSPSLLTVAVNLKGPCDQCPPGVELPLPIIPVAPTVPEVSPPPFIIAKREDFIGPYQGWTGPKTKVLLEKARGGVLIIDEAYNLCRNSHDSFGLEALTALNEFMSEHPEEIVVIFVGYLELLEKTIFRMQPGLQRRCTWKFKVEKYSGEGLSKIFLKQVTAKGFTVGPGVDLVGFFRRYRDNFAGEGGDTKRLVQYAELRHAAKVFEKVLEGPKVSVTRVFTLELLELAIQDLIDNNLGNNEIPSYFA